MRERPLCMNIEISLCTGNVCMYISTNVLSYVCRWLVGMYAQCCMIVCVRN